MDQLRETWRLTGTFAKHAKASARGSLDCLRNVRGRIAQLRHALNPRRPVFAEWWWGFRFRRLISRLDEQRYEDFLCEAYVSYLLNCTPPTSGLSAHGLLRRSAVLLAKARTEARRHHRDDGASGSRTLTRILSAALDRLPPHRYDLLVMQTGRGLAPSKIAATLNAERNLDVWTERDVSRELHLAQDELRRQLRGYRCQGAR